MGISGGGFDMYILGDSFLRAYYSIYDFDQNRVGLAAHNSSLSLEWKFPTWGVVVICISSAIILGIIGYVLYQRYKNKKVAQQIDPEVRSDQVTSERLI